MTPRFTNLIKKVDMRPLSSCGNMWQCITISPENVCAYSVMSKVKAAEVCDIETLLLTLT